MVFNSKFIYNYGMYPMAYHLIVSTHGTRLHGDERITVDRRMNKPGDFYVTTHRARRDKALGAMPHQPVYLSRDQRLFIQDAIKSLEENNE